MPDFEFTNPEGRRFTVTGPAGATTEQAWSVLQQHLGSANNQRDSAIGVPTILLLPRIGPSTSLRPTALSSQRATPLDGNFRAAWRSSLDLVDCTAAFSPFLETTKIADVFVPQIVQGFACQRRSSAGGAVYKRGPVAIERRVVSRAILDQHGTLASRAARALPLGPFQYSEPP